MDKILVFGAGRSAYCTISHLLEQAPLKGWKVTIADSSEENLQLCTSSFPHARIIVADVHDEVARKALIGAQDIVISLLPARFHILVAHDCLEQGVHLITPSYTTPALEELGPQVMEKGLIFINELGLDPGIDHMSAMEIIHRLKDMGAYISSFKSYCGGLMSPGSDDNPWRYKLTWNPYNVVRAGQDGALCRMHGRLKFVPYHRLFREYETISVDGEPFDGYYNRNSLRYISLYELEQATTFVRGTLRYPGFCRKWHYLVSMGLTSDRLPLELEQPYTWDELIPAFLPGEDGSLEDGLKVISGMQPEEEEVSALRWLWEGESELKPGHIPPADVLQAVLEKKWALNPGDNDRVVMVHEFIFELDGKNYKLSSWMDMHGHDSLRTAMAKTVGLPLALAAEHIAEGIITQPGMRMPTEADIYKPLLASLSRYGIRFTEEMHELTPHT